MVGTPCPRAMHELMVFGSARRKQGGNAETAWCHYPSTAGEQICFQLLEPRWAVNKILLCVCSGNVCSLLVRLHYGRFFSW